MASHIKSEQPRPSRSSSLYSLVTDRIIQSLEAGVVPWRKPWKGRAHLPCNAVSKRPYHGVNMLLLSLSPYVDHRWLTLKQANELGGRVRKGERSSIAVFWKRLDVESNEPDEEGKKRSVPLLRYYHVFNAEQCDGLKLPILMEDWHDEVKLRIDAAEAVVREMAHPPKIVEGGPAAYYLPRQDLVRIPPIQSFETAEAYYATLFHELGHATGHESRLNRPAVARQSMFGSGEYSREELVAELTSAFVCADVGIDNSTLENAASYIHGWLYALAGDLKAVVVAAGQAQRAADYIQGKHAEDSPASETDGTKEAVQ